MIAEKIHAAFQKKLYRKQSEVIQLKWQKVELERQLKALKERENASKE